MSATSQQDVLIQGEALKSMPFYISPSVCFLRSGKRVLVNHQRSGHLMSWLDKSSENTSRHSFAFNTNHETTLMSPVGTHVGPSALTTAFASDVSARFSRFGLTLHVEKWYHFAVCRWGRYGVGIWKTSLPQPHVVRATTFGAGSASSCSNSHT